MDARRGDWSRMNGRHRDPSWQNGYSDSRNYELRLSTERRHSPDLRVAASESRHREAKGYKRHAPGRQGVESWGQGRGTCQLRSGGEDCFPLLLTLILPAGSSPQIREQMRGATTWRYGYSSKNRRATASRTWSGMAPQFGTALPMLSPASTFAVPGLGIACSSITPGRRKPSSEKWRSYRHLKVTRIRMTPRTLSSK